MNTAWPAAAKYSVWRLFELVCASVGLLLLSPLFAVLALAVLLFSGRPVLFSQARMGRYAVQFRIWKFRTMHTGAAGPAITADGDSRVTVIGRWLRKFKLDELPQLFNVLRGDMSVVGPRPEVPQYVNLRSPLWHAVLQVRPGITDLATLIYRDEEKLLRTSGDADRLYRETVLPAKLRLNLAYLQTRCFWQDMRLIWLTVRYSLSPKGFNPACIHRGFMTGVENGGHLHSISSAIDR